MVGEYSVRVTGLKPLTKIFAALVQGMSTKKVMSRIGNFAMTEIKQRTSEGMDVNYDSFEDYTAGHRKTRAAKGLPVHIVDLFFYGTMMNAITFEAGEDQVRLFFQPTVGKTAKGRPASIKSPEKAYYLNEQREFFALSDKDMDEMRDIAIREIDRLLKES